jgi:hypothetical protein
LKELLEAPHTSADMAIASQAKNLYQSCINMENIEEEGEVPLQEVLAELGKRPTGCKLLMKHQTLLMYSSVLLYRFGL